jgi:hypothetical protein
VRQRYRFEARLRDRFLTDHAYAVRALSHPSERFFDRYEKMTVAFMQMDLKLCFRIGIGLVNNIALRAACRWHRGEIVALVQTTTRSVSLRAICGIGVNRMGS